eukprot:TRINITY_DN71636_c0_g1_i1.p1 TRINITY_DN71636_c0_g1~~TRINITY_DN71636_c0_g1_i1.p1  ORF type:complete len:152 (+),score=8.76 TRINITY_DN71636_c0_g1_i1:50-505(+)
MLIFFTLSALFASRFEMAGSLTSTLALIDPENVSPTSSTQGLGRAGHYTKPFWGLSLARARERALLAKRKTLLYKHIPKMGGEYASDMLRNAWRAMTDISIPAYKARIPLIDDPTKPHLREIAEFQPIESKDYADAFVIAGIRDACDYYVS